MLRQTWHFDARQPQTYYWDFQTIFMLFHKDREPRPDADFTSRSKEGSRDLTEIPNNTANFTNYRGARRVPELAVKARPGPAVITNNC